MVVNKIGALTSMLYIIDKDFRKAHQEISKCFQEKNLNSEDIMSLSRENKLEYMTALRITEEFPELISRQIEEVVETSIKKLRTFNETLNFISQTFEEIGFEYLVIKSFKKMLYTPEDVDILVRKNDYLEIVRAFIKKGVRNTSTTLKKKLIIKLHLGHPDYCKDGLINLDFYCRIPGHGLTCVDEEFLWKKPNYKLINDNKIPVPNGNADFISILGSLLFTDRKINFLDFHYLDHLVENMINIKELTVQSRKFGWEKQLTEIVSILKSLQTTLYSRDKIDGIDFPYRLPNGLLLRAMWGPVVYQTRNDPASVPSTFANIAFHSFISRVYLRIIGTG